MPQQSLTFFERPQDIRIPGMTYIQDFLSLDEAFEYYDWVENRPIEEWLQRDMARRVLQYGWRYDYQTKCIQKDHYIGELPPCLHNLAVSLKSKTDMFDAVPTQVIVNEYTPGQGIGLHTDNPGFGPTVATISLGDSWTMNFIHNTTGEREDVLLSVGSALVLTGEARHKWSHGIAKRKTEPDGRHRLKRISLTFRTVLHPSGG